MTHAELQKRIDLLPHGDGITPGITGGSIRLNFSDGPITAKTPLRIPSCVDVDFAGLRVNGEIQFSTFGGHGFHHRGCIRNVVCDAVGVHSSVSQDLVNPRLDRVDTDRVIFNVAGGVYRVEMNSVTFRDGGGTVLHIATAGGSRNAEHRLQNIFLNSNRQTMTAAVPLVILGGKGSISNLVFEPTNVPPKFVDKMSGIIIDGEWTIDELWYEPAWGDPSMQGKGFREGLMVNGWCRLRDPALVSAARIVNAPGYALIESTRQIAMDPVRYAGNVHIRDASAVTD